MELNFYFLKFFILPFIVRIEGFSDIESFCKVPKKEETSNSFSIHLKIKKIDFWPPEGFLSSDKH